MPSLNDTIAALATPVGTAALAVLRASGPDTPRIAAELLRRPPLPRVVRHGDYHDRSGTLIDDVLVTFFQGPRSYTGEDALEISCHGNPFIAQRILEDLLARGCRPAQPGEFTQRAFLNGRMDLSQAEAVMDVIHARSERALAAANQQLRGALGRRMNELVECLLGVLARVEAYIDFPDEDLPPADRGAILQDLGRLSEGTERLLATSHFGEILREGVKTVIVGAPNVGKSSLLNRLVGYDRALVSPEPGTTRDFIEERILIGPHCLRLIDTAGLNPSPTPLEQRGMDKTRERLADADLILHVLDGSGGVPDSDDDIRLPNGCKSLIILNKSDLCRSSTVASERLANGKALSVSALTGSGVAELTAEIVNMVDSFRRDAGEDLVVINARHSDALKTAQLALRRSSEMVEASDPAELVASELRAALNAYGDIVGKVDHERMLDQLFATFCIGK